MTLKIVQIVISVLLMFLVLIQTKNAGLSNAFGGGSFFYRSKRGLEKVIFLFTILLGVALVVNSLFLLLLG
ncbi:MAG: Preprotein translocase, SecG subunit [candidate division WWE3 bacterium GW2011_GWB1_47_11]|uniref:Protein-export membrane protein SecG n=2 Tax=Katanobacteria TaxID=422282 RepID=A0A0G1TUF5_UNCKA|nr:MAG: Preprotein translocase, SecG subunit [candidate division WWE3 bacterium GW2011_GWA2_46_9]KKU57768.1 MAG: Preprotein translocase, SecG subunit [candidate division WWE3 bacterium GW2011_GWB1_47_11]